MQKLDTKYTEGSEGRSKNGWISNQKISNEQEYRLLYCDMIQFYSRYTQNNVNCKNITPS